MDFSLRRANLAFAHVVQDHAHAGRLVAKHFLERGLQHFAFYSDSTNLSQKGRGDAFESPLSLHGKLCQTWRWINKARRGGRNHIWSDRRQWLMQRLKGAAKLLAVFAANGSLAVEVHEVCADARLGGPLQVAIVGIDDCLLSVGAHSSHISGVDARLEEQGYRGAELLDRMMRTGRSPSRTLLVQPSEVVTRKSSDVLAVPHEGVCRALRFILDRFADPVAIRDIAAATGMSERSLHLAFNRHLGITPGTKLIETRIEHARCLLATLNDKIEHIATQA